MKKFYVLLAVAAMLASCAETDLVNPIPENEPEAIGFETFANKTTRSFSENNNLESFYSAFGVWAYKTPTGGSESTVMNNYQVVNEMVGSEYKWVYDGKGPHSNQVLKYWDKLAAYEFFAYAPYNDTVSILSDVISIPDGQYAANENLQKDWNIEINENKFTGTGTATDKSTDWMIAAKVNRAAGAATAIVSETFSHTMSKLVVILKSDVATTEEVEVTSVSVGNVYGSGLYSYSYTTGTGEWTKSGDAKSISGQFGEIEGENAYYSMEYLLIPSNVAPTFSIEYTINGETFTITDKAIGVITSFEENTAYTLTVTIGPDPIVFDATTTNFGSDTPDPGLEIE